MNCHGCKWLDEDQKRGEGRGYCSMIVRSKTYRPNQGDRVRLRSDERCELYEEGKFEKRFENGTKGNDNS
jgi:hypothetical protein